MRLLFIFLLLFESNNCLLSQDIIINESQIYYQVEPVFNFKKGIVSLTFDDGTLSSFTLGMPLLDARQIPATFYVITGRIGYNLKKLILNAQLNHHEIASHSVDHKNLLVLSKDSVEMELLQSKEYLNNLFNNNECLTFSYPFNAFNNDVIEIAKKYYLACRSVMPGYNLIKSFDRYSLKVMSFNSVTKLTKANIWIDDAIQKGIWFIELVHGFSNDGFLPADLLTWEKHLDYMKVRESAIWFATVADAIKYHDESMNASLSCVEFSDSLYKVKIDDQLDDSLYNLPLSITIKIPNNWEGIRISGAEYKGTINRDQNKFLLMNALPNNSEISIKPYSIVQPIKNEKNITLISVAPNPFIDRIELSFETKKTLKFGIALKDIYGRTFLTTENISSDPINQIILSTSNIPKGTYILELIDKTTYQKINTKVIKIE